MTEAGALTIPEEVIKEEVEQLQELLAQRRIKPDPTLHDNEIEAIVSDLLPQVQTFASEAGAKKEPVDFGNGQVAHRSTVEMEDSKGFSWLVFLGSNITPEGEFVDGLEHVSVEKRSRFQGLGKEQETRTFIHGAASRVNNTSTRSVSVNLAFVVDIDGGLAFGDNAKKKRGVTFGDQVENTGTAVKSVGKIIVDLKAATNQ